MWKVLVHIMRSAKSDWFRISTPRAKWGPKSSRRPMMTESVLIIEFGSAEAAMLTVKSGNPQPFMAKYVDEILCYKVQQSGLSVGSSNH